MFYINLIIMNIHTESDECKLTCESLQTGERMTTDSDVTDGTKCSYDKPHDICVMGECHVSNTHMISQVINEGEFFLILTSFVIK